MGMAKADRLMLVAIWVILILTVLQGSLVAYRNWWRPSQPASEFALPPDVPDWRGESLPDLSSITPVADASLQEELGADTTIVAFLRTTCSACAEAKPTLEALRTKYPNFGFVGIFAEPRQVVLDYEAQYPSFVDQNGAVFETLGVRGIPMFLVVRDGSVMDQIVGWSADVGKNFEVLAGR